MSFLVNMIKADENSFLKENATHIVGPYWFYEGDLEFCDVKSFEDLGQSVVPSLGGLSESELIAIAEIHFCVLIGEFDTGMFWHEIS